METPRPKVPYVQLFKFVLVGDRGVGKSCLLQQFTDQEFRQEHDLTIGVDFGTPVVAVDGKPTKLLICDTAGQESFRSIERSWYRDAAAVILVYDITRRETFDHVVSKLQDARKLAPADVTVMLVGNKCDMSDERSVSYEEAVRFAMEHGILFMEASARTAQNVEEAFSMAARIVSKTIEDRDNDLSNKKRAQNKEALCWGLSMLAQLAGALLGACKGWRPAVRRIGECKEC
ncbi:hypothetical protein ACP70R_000025 [Stipagrostis hirtigluma subsp. patula]